MDELDDLLDPNVKETGSNSNEFARQAQLPNANAILVLGILSIVGCVLYGLPGLVCGIIALALYQKDKKIYASNRPMYEASHKNARGGYICAIIGTCLSALYFLFAIIAFIGLASGGFRF